MGELDSPTHDKNTSTPEDDDRMDDLTDEDYIALGKILARFIREDGVTYWGEESRPYEKGQQGGMTIDQSITVSTAELALLDRVGEPW